MAINPIDPWKTVVQENCINYYYYYYYYYYKIAERYYAQACGCVYVLQVDNIEQCLQLMTSLKLDVSDVTATGL